MYTAESIGLSFILFVCHFSLRCHKMNKAESIGLSFILLVCAEIPETRLNCKVGIPKHMLFFHC